MSARLEGRGSVVFTNSRGEDVVRYTDLGVTDARGESLPAWFELRRGALRIVVRDEGAIYPLTVDPFATAAA